MTFSPSSSHCCCISCCCFDLQHKIHKIDEAPAFCQNPDNVEHKWALTRFMMASITSNICRTPSLFLKLKTSAVQKHLFCRDEYKSEEHHVEVMSHLKTLVCSVFSLVLFVQKNYKTKVSKLSFSFYFTLKMRQCYINAVFLLQNLLLSCNTCTLIYGANKHHFCRQPPSKMEIVWLPMKNSCF